MPDGMKQQLQQVAASQDAAEQQLPAGFREFGSTGLQRMGGSISEEYLPELKGIRGVKVFKEMSENDPIGSAMTFSLGRLISRLPWEIMPPENASPEEDAATAFTRSAFTDMDTPWEQVLEDALSMVVYGWCFMETTYKIRGGNAVEEWRRSAFDDGRIGWKSFRIRAQETLVQWIFDSRGNLLGMQQMDPNGGGLREIPLAKALLFRTTTYKDNPEGRSLLRGAYRPWYFKKRMEEFEGIGVERDLAGLPVAWLAPEYFGEDPKYAQTLRTMQQVVADVRNDATGGLVLPRAYDDKGNKLIDFELMASPGQKAFDTNAIIERKSREMAMSILMDFLMLGHENVGSHALGTAKIDLWETSIEWVAKGIAAVFQEYAIRPLLKANSIAVARPPQLVFGDLANADLGTLGQFVKDMVDAGVLTPGPEIERYVREQSGLPIEEELPYGQAPAVQ